MRKVIGIGETVLDIIFRDNQPIAAVPGGSTFNAIVSLGRSGVPATLISEVGADRVGDYVASFLSENGVDTSAVLRSTDDRSLLSLAFLNERNEASYLFYGSKNSPQQDIILPDIQPDDIVIFGSWYALNPTLRSQITALLDHARNRGAIIYYDINFRPAHKGEVVKITANLIDNLQASDIVRGSNEDIQTLYEKSDPNRVYDAEIAFHCRNFICTQGAGNIVVRSGNGLRNEYPVSQTTTVSTIGAGDSFNAGFVYALIRYGIRRQDIEAGLQKEQWDQLVKTAQAFAADCCSDIYNYVSPEFGRQRKAELG